MYNSYYWFILLTRQCALKKNASSSGAIKSYEYRLNTASHDTSQSRLSGAHDVTTTISGTYRKHGEIVKRVHLCCEKSTVRTQHYYTHVSPEFPIGKQYVQTKQ